MITSLSLQIVILVPEIDGLLAELLDDRLIRVVVAVGARKRDDAEFHHQASRACTLAISKSSVTGLASSRSHISRVELLGRLAIVGVDLDDDVAADVDVVHAPRSRACAARRRRL